MVLQILCGQCEFLAIINQKNRSIAHVERPLQLKTSCVSFPYGSYSFPGSERVSCLKYFDELNLTCRYGRSHASGGDRGDEHRHSAVEVDLDAGLRGDQVQLPDAHQAQERVKVALERSKSGGVQDGGCRPRNSDTRYRRCPRESG